MRLILKAEGFILPIPPYLKGNFPWYLLCKLWAPKQFGVWWWWKFLDARAEKRALAIQFIEWHLRFMFKNWNIKIKGAVLCLMAQYQLPSISHFSTFYHAYWCLWICNFVNSLLQHSCNKTHWLQTVKCKYEYQLWVTVVLYVQNCRQISCLKPCTRMTNIVTLLCVVNSGCIIPVFPVDTFFKWRSESHHPIFRIIRCIQVSEGMCLRKIFYYTFYKNFWEEFMMPIFSKMLQFISWS